jgi:hypothetical protein
MKTRPLNTNTPAVTMVWSVTDAVIESPDVLVTQFHDIRSGGFGGIAVYVRCSRYSWHDPAGRRALQHIGKLCRKFHMAYWIGPDPRFVSRQLIGKGEGLEVLMFGDSPRAEHFPNLVDVTEGEFSVRCRLTPRHVHTLTEVAITYHPTGIERSYAVKFAEEGTAPVAVKDITRITSCFYNARDGYVEGFGKLPRNEGWKVLVFFRAITNHVDYSDPEQMAAYLKMLNDLRRNEIGAGGIMWDEAGYTCTYGTLPYSPKIRRTFATASGEQLAPALWKLIFRAGDESHIRVRNAYYRAVQGTLNKANASMTRHVLRTWGKETVSGIHDTWHFESADMNDMNHGSLDLWAGGRSKTGGFVDLGDVGKLHDPQSPWYANLAAMSLTAASLGRVSAGKFAYNNLWTVGDDGGAGWQTSVMEHCVNCMALFGTRWLAHAYGPVGTIGQERTFLGSPPLPGYPDHSTWPKFPAWCRKLEEHFTAVEWQLPESNILLVYPVESMFAEAGPGADRIAASVFSLMLELVDHHYQVDVRSASALRGGKWKDNAFVLDGNRYAAVLMPYPEVCSPELLAVIRNGGHRVVMVGNAPWRMSDGKLMPFSSWTVSPDNATALAHLEQISHVRLFTPPAQSWATVTRITNGHMVTLVPARAGLTYSGDLVFGKETVKIPATSGLIRIFFPTGGAPVIHGVEDANR